MACTATAYTATACTAMASTATALPASAYVNVTASISTTISEATRN